MGRPALTQEGYQGCNGKSVQRMTVEFATWLINFLATQVRVSYEAPLPTGGCLLVVAHHRSVLDVPILITGMARSLHPVCHPYLQKVPIVREMIQQFGGLYLGRKGWSGVFQETQTLLQQGEGLIIFPEGGQRMTSYNPSHQQTTFRRGLAHLALRAGYAELPLVPVALVSRREMSGPLVPLQALQLFDRKEPLFQQGGWHPWVLYEQMQVMVGQPRLLRAEELVAYRSGQAFAVTQQLAQEMAVATEALTHRAYQELW